MAAQKVRTGPNDGNKSKSVQTGGGPKSKTRKAK